MRFPDLASVSARIVSAARAVERCVGGPAEADAPRTSDDRVSRGAVDRLLGETRGETPLRALYGPADAAPAAVDDAHERLRTAHGRYSALRAAREENEWRLAFARFAAPGSEAPATAVAEHARVRENGERLRRAFERVMPGEAETARDAAASDARLRLVGERFRRGAETLEARSDEARGSLARIEARNAGLRRGGVPAFATRSPRALWASLRRLEACARRMRALEAASADGTIAPAAESR